ncbi:MAG TPA: isoprenylcysteine carboxylmethyltransferase family protein, partial [Candidatus Paceibacterota bacterium]
LALRIPYVRMIAVRVRVAGVAPWSAPLAVFGVLLCVFGIGYAIWARWHLGKNWSPAPALKEKHELVTSGPYRYVRHPIYTGTLIAALGSGIADPYWFFMFALMLVMFVRRVFVEERLMMQEFPEQYPQYKKHTWALIPWVW